MARCHRTESSGRMTTPPTTSRPGCRAARTTRLPGPPSCHGPAGPRPARLRARLLSGGRLRERCTRRSREKIPVEPFISTGHHRKVEVELYVSTTGVRVDRIGPLQSDRNPRWIIQHEPGLLVHHDLGDTSSPQCDHRSAARHGFDHDHSKRLVPLNGKYKTPRASEQLPLEFRIRLTDIPDLGPEVRSDVRVEVVTLRVFIALARQHELDAGFARGLYRKVRSFVF